MSKDAIRQTANAIAQMHPEGACYIFEDHAFSHGDGNVVQRLNMALLTVCKEEERKAFAGWLVNRPVSSTKELTVAEGLAIAKSQSLLEGLYLEFIREQSLW